MKKILLLIVTLAMITGIATAEPITVSGVVTIKDDGEPAIGAAVQLKGTTKGTITDLDGKYSITAEKGQTLVFTYVGMQTQEVVITGAVHNVVMSSDAQLMEEVVVTAMGVRQEKKKLNFAVQSVGDDAINDSKAANFVNALQGKISGVSVTTGGGSPNSGQQIILRGISSINSSQGNEPLFVLDGMPLSGGAN
ncbi:MAG: carboxypeptidase-like regulatory domain-containing protein, partial [Bacteroidales bacterium]|nr:carboxypeptidase-like regulatory domain-containing protein [Bacteroidales bacterium]